MKGAHIDETISDGTRLVGGIKVSAGSFVPYLADGGTLHACQSIVEARAAVHAADVDRRKLDRMANDGGRPD